MYLITCSQTTYALTGRYINSIIQYIEKNQCIVKLHNTAEITNVMNYITDMNIHVSLIIFIQYIPNIIPLEYNNKIIYWNMDQIVELNYRKFSIFDKIKNIKCPIIDYSEKNIEIISSTYIDKDLYHFPYLKYDNDTIFKPLHSYEYDVGIIYYPSPHGLNIIDKLKENNIKLNLITNKFGLDRDIEICKCKIILNLHYVSEANILETIRCCPILYRKIVLISEDSLYDKNIDINNIIIYTSYENIINKVKEVINNYTYYHNIINTFDFDKQNKIFKTEINRFLLNFPFKIS